MGLEYQLNPLANRKTTVDFLQAGKYRVTPRGYYGEFGGAFVPEMLYPNVEELAEKYLDILGDESFREEFGALLRDYVGRPSPLYLAGRLSERYGARIYLKRED